MTFWRFNEADLTLGIEVTGQLDPMLGLLSSCIAIIGAVGMFWAVERVRAANLRANYYSWLVVAGFTMGFGIWGMHFTAMLAFILPFPVDYDFWITTGSFLPAMLGSYCAAFLLAQKKPNYLQLTLGALLMAVGIGGMHYIGMEAMNIPGMMYYDFTAFVSSILVVFIIALISLYATIKLSRTTNKALNLLALPVGSILLGGAVTAMHHVAMAAAHFFVAPEHITGATEMTHNHQTHYIIAVIVATVGIIWLGRLIDHRLSEATVSIQESELRNRSIINSMLDSQVVIDSNGLIQSLNSATVTIFGYTTDELIGKNVSILMPEPYHQHHDGYLKRFMETRQSDILNTRQTSQLMGRRRSGEIFPIELLIASFEMGGNEFFSGFIKDVSKQRKIEDQNRLMTEAVEHAADGMVIFNADKIIEYVNPSFKEQLGYDSSDVVGCSPRDLAWGRSDKKIYADMWQTVEKGATWSGQYCTARRDGSLIDEDVTLSPVRDKEGAITHYVQIRRNVTERKQLESQLLQAQKLESIGQLAAGIAHEINTPSQYVGDNTRFLKDAFGDFGGLLDKLKELITSNNESVKTEVLEKLLDEADVDYLQDEIPRAIGQSLEGVERITRIVLAMKDFSHPGQQKELVDINQAIESTVIVATNEWRYVADLDLQLDPDLAPVPCNAGEIKQVILNIIVNASHAIADVVDGESGGRGKITVTTSALDDWAEIRITDTGSGMTEDVRARVFDPFFTTKEVGKGTGQGLSLAYAIIAEKHAGRITVDSEPGKGTCFLIKLPFSLDSDMAA